jgi:hypothetical protein
MSEQPTPTGEEPTAPEPADDSVPDDAPADMASLRKVRHEAATLRAQLREARSTIESLEGATARADALEHAEVERVAAEHLIDGSDIWRVDADTRQSFFDDEFHSLTRDRIVQAAKRLASEKPHLGRPPSGPPPSDRPIESLHPGASPEEKPVEVTWSSALRRTGI